MAAIENSQIFNTLQWSFFEIIAVIKKLNSFPHSVLYINVHKLYPTHNVITVGY